MTYFGFGIYLAPTAAHLNLTDYLLAMRYCPWRDAPCRKKRPVIDVTTSVDIASVLEQSYHSHFNLRLDFITAMTLLKVYRAILSVFERFI